MKKTTIYYFLTICLLVSCNKKSDEEIIPDASTIDVEEKNTAIFNKLTATWCSACGSWGWMLNEELTGLIGDKAIPISTFASYRSLFYNQLAADFAQSFEQFNGWPAFYINGQNKTAYVTGGVSYQGTRASCVSAAEAFVDSQVIVNTGFLSAYKNNTLNIVSKTQFFSDAAVGEYYVGAYVLEHEVSGEQNGKPDLVLHPHVLRASAHTSSFGERITVEPTTGNTFLHTFSLQPDSSWDRNKLEVITIIWKKNGNKYAFVNASRESSK